MGWPIIIDTSFLLPCVCMLPDYGSVQGQQEFIHRFSLFLCTNGGSQCMCLTMQGWLSLKTLYHRSLSHRVVSGSVGYAVMFVFSGLCYKGHNMGIMQWQLDDFSFFYKTMWTLSVEVPLKLLFIPQCSVFCMAVNINSCHIMLILYGLYCGCIPHSTALPCILAGTFIFGMQTSVRQQHMLCTHAQSISAMQPSVDNVF